MTLLPRVQVLRNSKLATPSSPVQHQNTTYRIVASDAAVQQHQQQQINVAPRGTTLVLREAKSQHSGLQQAVAVPPGPYAALARTATAVKPLRVVSERNVMEYVCSSDLETNNLQQQPKYEVADSYEFINIVEEDESSMDGVRVGSRGRVVGVAENNNTTDSNSARCILLPPQPSAPHYQQQEYAMLQISAELDNTCEAPRHHHQLFTANDRTRIA